jgi:hypothetical protein
VPRPEIGAFFLELSFRKEFKNRSIPEFSSGFFQSLFYFVKNASSGNKSVSEFVNGGNRKN